MRGFIGIDFAQESAPDATTLLKFRRLQEGDQLSKAVISEINGRLSERGPRLREGKTVGATIIGTSSSTENEAKARDAEMHQAKKGNAWHFEMKTYIGADADLGVMQCVHSAAASERDVAHIHDLLHQQEQAVFSDAGYTNASERCEFVEAVESMEIRADIDWHAAQRRSVIQRISEGSAMNIRHALE